MYTFDTNTIIYYLKDDAKAVQTIEEIMASNPTLYISTITELELLSLSSLTSRELKSINSFLPIFSILSVDSQIAKIAASVRRNYKLKTPDSIIAATALFTQSTLLTRNVNDFKKVKEIETMKI